MLLTLELHWIGHELLFQGCIFTLLNLMGQIILLSTLLEACTVGYDIMIMSVLTPAKIQTDIVERINSDGDGLTKFRLS